MSCRFGNTLKSPPARVAAGDHDSTILPQRGKLNVETLVRGIALRTLGRMKPA